MITEIKFAKTETELRIVELKCLDFSMIKYLGAQISMRIRTLGFAEKKNEILKIKHMITETKCARII